MLQGGIPGKRSLYYVSYDRTYKNLPVIGGDAVVMTDASGNVLTTTAAPKGTLSTSTTPKVTAAQAEKTAEARLAHVDRVVSNTLSVLAGKKSQLVYETIVEGHKATGVPSRLHVYVNAVTGSVVGIKDDARADGNDNSQFYGPTNPIDTTNNSTVDSTRPGLQCDDYATGRPFTSSTNNFGTGSAYDKVTGCGDVMYIVQHEWSMLGSWLGRSGIDGNGGGNPVLVGLNQVNAFWTGDHIEVGHNNAGQWITAIDVVGHEEGHAIDQYTPGGAGTEAGLGEATGDIFGAMTESYTNSSYDPPDYTVGEKINLTGTGPIRDMRDPSSVNGDPNCYSSAIPRTEVHKAAGPFNHWFYLVAQGSSNSPTCNNSTVSGIGIQAAGRVFYNAMLMKTSGATYFSYRKWTLAAAKALDPTCAQYNTVKAAWNAVSVPAQSGEATCSGSTPPPPSSSDFSMAASPSSGSAQQGGSTTSTVSTTTTGGSAQTVTLSATGQPTGVTVTFSPKSVTSGSSSSMKVAASSSAAAGTYPITIKGTGSTTHTVSYTLTVGGSTPPPGGSCGRLTPWSATTSYVPGDKVSYNNHEYDSTWYSTGAQPDAPNSWSVWKDAGAC